MALINRVSRLFKADFHAVLDHIEEPELLLRQAIRDMEDDLAARERQLKLCEHEQYSMNDRKRELESALEEIGEQLDLCFASEKDDLAKNLIRKKLEAERLLKRLSSKYAANEKTLAEQRRSIDENQTTLEGLRQKAELVAQCKPAQSDGRSDFDDVAWMAREMTVSDDEVEVAFLREKNIRSTS